jgi:NAD(P)H-dependent flavin oxidoreductase YrpB (nitropropane dioxygenase family)
MGREWELRARQEAIAALERARETGDVDNATLLIGQDAGLIHDIPPPAGEIVERIVPEAEALLKDRLPNLVRLA